MKTWGYPCDVIAPSLIPSKRGERRKNDFRDAQNLARLYANGLLSVVHPPSEEEESVRALIRCRMAFKESEKRAKHQINALLLAHDYRWPKTKWTDEHRTWLLESRLPNEHLQQVLEEHLGHLEYLRSRVQCLNEQIKQIAQSDIYAPSVNKLRALKGIDTLTAMVLITEITDFRRFPNPGALMSFLGLIPSENSSGDKQKGGSITKAGNHRCRTMLIESVQHYTRRPCVNKRMSDTLSQVDAHSAQVALKCMKRLHKAFLEPNHERKDSSSGDHRCCPGICRLYLGHDATGTRRSLICQRTMVIRFSIKRIFIEKQISNHRIQALSNRTCRERQGILGSTM